jgi:hypothetical protein
VCFIAYYLLCFVVTVFYALFFIFGCFIVLLVYCWNKIYMYEFFYPYILSNIHELIV